MIGFLTVIHVIICIFLVISILLQSSKGGGLAGVFGGGSMSGVFGARGAASFLSKVTLWLAIGFAVTTLSIALLSAGLSGKQKGLIERQMELEETASPASILPTVSDEELASPVEGSAEDVE